MQYLDTAIFITELSFVGALAFPLIATALFVFTGLDLRKAPRVSVEPPMLITEDEPLDISLDDIEDFERATPEFEPMKDWTEFDKAVTPAMPQVVSMGASLVVPVVEGKGKPVDKMTRDELRVVARGLGVKYGKMNKGEMLKAIKAIQEVF